MRNTIGGEFEINPLAFSSISNQVLMPMDGFWYASGRSALYYIILHAQKQYQTKRILLPEWLCSSMVDVVKLVEIDCCFYKLDTRFLPDLGCLSVEKGDLVVVVNYFGLQNIEPTIEKLKAKYPHVPVASDLVQAYFEMEKPTCADYRYTSLRKTFAVPDGGWVLSKHDDLEQPTARNDFSELKLKGSEIKFDALTNDSIDDQKFLQHFELAECVMSHRDQVEATLNEKSLPLFSSYHLNTIAHTRRQNAKFIIDKLSEMGITPIIEATNEWSVPLFVPIKINNRDKIRKELREAGIFCPVHWPQVEGIVFSEKMAKSELSIVVDQRYWLSDMARIIEVIKRWV